jgi:hypothetical protein
MGQSPGKSCSFREGLYTWWLRTDLLVMFCQSGTTTNNEQRPHFTPSTSTPLVFAGSVLWTEKIHRTELNRTAVRSFFRLQLPKFCVIPVAGCLI